MSTPTTGQEIEVQYGLEEATFQQMSASERALYRAAYALDALHVKEDGPPYLNRGDDVDRYNQVAGAALGSPWCAAFRTCLLVDSGVDLKSLPEDPASVHAWRAWAIENGRYSQTPQRGSCGLLIFSPMEGHLTTVTHVDASTGTVEVIAGNTNTDGGREGYEIARKIYRISAFDGFVGCEGL